MLEVRSTTQVATTGVAAVQHNKQRQRLLVAIVLLLGALVTVLVKDRDFWFSSAEVAATEDAQPATASPVETASTPVPTQAAAPAIKKSTAQHAAVPNSTKHVALQPLTMEVVAGAKQNVSHPTTVAATTEQAVQMASAKAPDYPLLGGQTSVQGSVLLQALIGADGLVEDMRILSGPSILVPAAREAVRQWRFKPFVQNGKPVETQARVTVNFSINVSNTTARLQPTSITSDGAI